MNNREATKVIQTMLAVTDLRVRSNLTADMVTACRMGMKALEQTEWIPVSTGKMPTSYVAVEVTVVRRDKTWNQTPYIRLAEWHEWLKDWFEIPYPIDQPSGERLSESDGGDATVIAWRPLGEPYKEDRNVESNVDE